MSFKDRLNKVAKKTADLAGKAAKKAQETLDAAGDIAGQTAEITADLAGKTAKKTGEIVDQGMDKAVELSEHKKTPQYVDKIIKEVTKPKSTKTLVAEGVLGVALGVAFGGALIPVVAGAAVEGYIGKHLIDKFNAKKSAKKAAQNDNETATPKAGTSKPAPKARKRKSAPKGPKGGPTA